MSTLVQIESAVAGLPTQDQGSLLTWLQGRLVASNQPQSSTPETLKIFRQLQTEVGLTAQEATAWKNAVVDARGK